MNNLYLVDASNNLVVDFVKNEPRYIATMKANNIDIASWVTLNGDFDNTKSYKADNGNLKELTQTEIEHFILAPQELEELKILKLQKLDAEAKDSKSVFIKNGHSLTITADDADRDFFIKNIEDSINSVHLKENFLEVLEYRQFTASKVFRVRAVAYLWRYVFGEYNKQRVANKLMYKTFKVAINNAATKEILDSINFKFAQALVVDINDKVAEIEADKNTPEGVLKAIDDAKDDKGIVHLVKDLTA